MKLYYWNENQNFGDQLNTYVWPQLLPNFFDDNSSITFIGIGTLLNHLMPKSPKTVVFGSGVGYGAVPQIDQSWVIYCLRGPLSAKSLGVDDKYAVTDGGIPVRRLFQPTKKNVSDLVICRSFTA